MRATPWPLLFLLAACLDAPRASPRLVQAAQSPPSAPETSSSAPPRNANLVLVTIDSLRPDVGFMGYPHPTTPNLDKLAARAVVFDRAYATASDIGRSLGPALIGRYASEAARDGAHYTRYLPENVFVAERLRQARVRTLGGAAHFYLRPEFGLTQGMDAWDDSAVPEASGGDEDRSVTSSALTDRAIALLSRDENTARPFFAWFHYSDPRAPYVEHADAPRFDTGGGSAGAPRAAYDGEVWFTDRHVGRLLEFIERQAWGKDTAIVVTSDHGQAFLEHHMTHAGVELWEVLVHVPLVVYVPGAPPHRVPVKRSQIDLAPTILGIFGVTAAAGELAGRSLVADVVAARDSYEERDVLFDMPASPFAQMRRALLSGASPGMKLVHFGGQRYALYDLARDEGEQSDLSHDGDRLAPMRARLDAAVHALHVAAPVPAPD